MPWHKYKIAFISAEVDPFSKSGGLADVARSLPKALKRQGYQVIVITPFYAKSIDAEKFNLKKIKEDIEIKIDKNNRQKISVWQGELMDDLPIYFIENKKYFGQRKELYGSGRENHRFMLFNLAVLKLLIKLRFKADIIHCQDWHTGLIPYYLKNDFKKSEVLKNTATVFTIHNLTFQLGSNWWEIPEEKRDDGRSKLPDFESDDVEYINFAKRAILNADVINAVSERYAEEIMTKDFGQDLHRVLKNRSDRVFGIVNGIDYKDYNPRNDPGLYRNFDYYSTNIKKKNKKYLQKKLSLPENGEIPMFCMTSRIAEQKGFDLIKDIADIIFRFNLQLIIMGDGEEKMIEHLKNLQKDYPKKLVYLPFDFKLETSLYAGSEFNLIPSRFEPCGLTQMKGMRYGCIPIARHVGGYVDTVSDYDPKYKSGNGFTFKKYDSRAMIVAIARALELYHREKELQALSEKIMRQSFSWEYPARKYTDLFSKALAVKKENGKTKNK